MLPAVADAPATRAPFHVAIRRTSGAGCRPGRRVPVRDAAQSGNAVGSGHQRHAGWCITRIRSSSRRTRPVGRELLAFDVISATRRRRRHKTGRSRRPAAGRSAGPAAASAFLERAGSDHHMPRSRSSATKARTSGPAVSTRLASSPTRVNRAASGCHRRAGDEVEHHLVDVGESS